MTNLTIGRDGEITLPSEICDRYGLKPETPVRVVEMRNSILLFPITDAPISAELVKELEEWQSLSAETWSQFPYADKKE